MAKNQNVSPFEDAVRTARWSKFLYWIGTRWSILFMLIYTLRLILMPIFSQLMHLAFDRNPLQEGYAWIDEMCANAYTPYLPVESVPDTTNLATSMDKLLLFDQNLFLIRNLVFLGVVAGLYIASLLWRQHNGEIAPHSSDSEARTIKRKLIRGTSSSFFSFYDEDRKVKNIEKRARMQLRFMRVNVHTVIESGHVQPTKYFLIRIRRVNNLEVNNKMERKINKVEEMLNSLTGVSFGQQEQSSDFKYYLYRGSKEVALRESVFVKHRRKKGKTVEQAPEFDYTFPLELFNDMTPKIKKQEVKAQAYAEGLRQSVPIFLASKGVKSDFAGDFVGKTSIRQDYKVAFTKSLPNLEDLQSGLDSSLGTEGVLIRLIAGKLNIEIPLPDDAKIPIDYPTMIREMTKKGKLDATEAVIGQSPDDTLVQHPLAKMPHALLSGTTGAGKSVLINSMIISILTHVKPDELKLAFIDPKLVEFAPYKGLPYMIADPIIDMKKAYTFMLYLTAEMDRRYDVFAQIGTKNIANYQELYDMFKDVKPIDAENLSDDENDSDAIEKYLAELSKVNDANYTMDSFKKLAGNTPHKLNLTFRIFQENGKIPYIVTVIDEFSDLIGLYKEVEKPVIRIGQKARAAGIHAIIATQSPRREVITGLIKANFPSRIAMMAASNIESQIILDKPGAEKLRPHGDFLIKMNGGNEVRGQAPFVSEDEINSIFKYIRDNYPAPELVDFEAELKRMEEAGHGGDGEDGDELQSDVDAFRKPKTSKSGFTAKIPKSEKAQARMREREAMAKEKRKEKKVVRKKIDSSRFANILPQNKRKVKDKALEEKRVAKTTEKTATVSQPTVSKGKPSEQGLVPPKAKPKTPHQPSETQNAPKVPSMPKVPGGVPPVPGTPSAPRVHPPRRPR